MLRRIDPKAPWRSLDQNFWPEDLPLGGRTVIYGHNGSGKSTLSELLLELAEGSSPTDLVWEDHEKKRTTINSGEVIAAPPISVFTRKWVETNLSAFLDGESASAIVTLGHEAIDAKEEETRLTDEIDKRLAEANKAEERRKAANAEVDNLARAVQDRLVAELKEFDYSYFTKNRFTIARVKHDLRSFEGEAPDSKAHAQALKRLAERAPTPIPEVPAPPEGITSELQGLSDLLAETPTRAAIAALEDNPTAQKWVEDGLELHEGVDHCFFCAGEITNERHTQLARHFDESWLRIRGRTKTLIEAVTREKQQLSAWLSKLPATDSLAGDVKPAYEEAWKNTEKEAGKRLDVLETIETTLAIKADDPSAAPEAPDWSVLLSALSTATLNQAVARHNEQANHHREMTAERTRTVMDHLVGTQAEAFRTLEGQAQELAFRSSACTQTAEQTERQLNEVRQAMFTTKDMADTLTRDLSRVYGNGHLSVTVTEDGKSYECRRSVNAASNLSDGERTTLSLLYFLRKLEDEQTPGGDPSKRIVVIDDPSSSLDRESLFSTHQWLVDKLKRFGQYIVLTHDFNLLRLFLKSQNNTWGKSMKKIDQGNSNESTFPKVSFLEMYADVIGGQRRSQFDKLPRFLLNNISEYAYLFSMVMTGIANPKDHERLFLLPNASRRVLEIFASYKAPHRTNFLQALEELVRAQDGEPYRDVYDFCNRFSHGEGNESVDVLDARTVHGQIMRCMQFLKEVDGEHFERMCTATDVDPTMLPQGPMDKVSGQS
ncbi:AAA family ATPase [Nesterenkonia sp. F]|uniref:AAA family ATPase n=1 Tax=Nesterenkonia sp. F TaxID=795955 RepID=UPI000307F81B|nr:AAA family ATPase [Nesterenkonia sp. F]